MTSPIVPGLITEYAKIRRSYVSASNTLRKESALGRLPPSSDIEQVQDETESSIQQELLRSIGEKNSIIQELVLVKATHSKETQKLQVDLKKSSDDKKELIQQHKETMNAFLNEIEHTVDAYKSEMEKRGSTIKTLQDELACFQKEISQKEDEYNSERAHHSKDMCLLRSQMEKLLEDKKEMKLYLQKQFDFAQQSTEDRHRAEMKVAKDALGALGIQHEQELGQVEQSVKQMIESKDNKLQEAIHRGEEANERAKTFEMCIAKIENGFEDFPP